MNGPSQRRGRIPHPKTIALIIIVIAIIAYLALTVHGVSALGTNETVLLAPGQTSYFMLKNNPSVYSIYLKNTTTAYANFYVSKVPVLASPIVSFGLVGGQAINVSTNGTAQGANLQVKLISSTNSNARVNLIPVPAGFTVRISSGVTTKNPSSFYSINSTASQTTTTPPPSTNSTTTTSSGVTTSTTTIATTVSGKSKYQIALQNISVVLNTTPIGTLMKDYNILYSKDTSCTASQYNTTLLSYAHLQAAGPYTFYNATLNTPTSLTVNAVQLNNGLYAVNYTASVPQRSLSGVAVKLDISGTGVITNQSFVSTGIYQGLNYSALVTAYNTQSGISGPCGALIP